MKQVSIRNIVIPSRSRSGNYPTGSTVIPGGGGSNATIDLSKYMKLALWLENFEAKTDTDGNQYIYAKKPLVSVGGFIAYCSDEAHVPSIFEGIPIDNDTIYWDESTGVRILKAKGSSGGSDFDATAMWSALLAATSEQINKSHLTDALSGYALQTSLDEVSTKLNDFLEGSDTDTIINKWKELEAFLSGMQATDNLAEILSNKADTTYVNSELSKYVTLATEQTIDGLKHFTNGLTIGVTKHKIYEKDGNILIEGNVLVTGGITAYSDGSGSGGSGGGGIDVNVLWEILGGTGTQQINITHLTDALTWNNISSKPSWIGDTKPSYTWDEISGKPSWIGSSKPSYNWSEIGSKPTTLSGYGIAANDVLNTLKTVDGIASGLDADLLDGIEASGFSQRKDFGFTNNTNIEDWVKYNSDTQRASNFFSVAGWSWADDRTLKLNDEITITRMRYTAMSIREGNINSPWQQQAVLFLPTYDDYMMYIVQMNTNDTTSNWDKRIKRYADYDTIINGNVYSATKLQTARTIWGQSFDGTGNVDGNLTINFNDYPSILLNSLSSRECSLYFINNSGFRWAAGTGVWGVEGFGLGIYSETNNGVKFCVLNNGNVGIGTIAPGFKLDVNGTVNADKYTFRAASTDDVCWGISNERISAGISTARGVNIGTLLVSDAWADYTKVPTNGIWCRGNIISNSEVYANGWLRTYGNVGWYSETYGGGWYMIDPTYVRSYNGKKVYSGGGYLAPYYGGMWISMATRSEIIDGDQNQSTDAAHALYRVKTSGGHAVVFGGLDNSVGFYGFYKSRIDTNENGTDWSTTWDATNGTITHRGNFLATGGITCYASDQRAKTVIEQISLSLKQIANAPTIRFKWNNWKIKDDGKTHIGGIAQYMQKLLPETVLEAGNMLNMDYATTGYIFAVQTAKHLIKTDTEVERLKKRVKRLEKRLKQLGYEEANIMDD